MISWQCYDDILSELLGNNFKIQNSPYATNMKLVQCKTF
jgi:hypothetical protein